MPPTFEVTGMPINLEADDIDNIESTKFESEGVTVSLEEDVNPEAGGVDSIKSTKLECTEDPIHYKANEISVQFLVPGNTSHIFDGFNWLKYGQKNRKNSIHPRSYFRCADRDCHVKKQTELSSDCEGTVSITYYGKHNHLPPNNHVSSNAKRPKH
ncbi:hypothetical protein KP509_24G019100 [Ceratopteris richardii]|nr:hypothetical protein KP509_24G019100 [Ceratopteris richardii]